jgi:hypothetical protein
MANRSMSLLRSVYRRPWVDREGRRNPLDLGFAANGRWRPA